MDVLQGVKKLRKLEIALIAASGLKHNVFINVYCLDTYDVNGKNMKCLKPRGVLIFEHI